MKWKILLLASLLGIILYTLVDWMHQRHSSAAFKKAYAAFESKDYATAMKEWTPLAEQGDASAQTNLGLMYDKGAGVPKDEKLAVYWYRKAAEQGDGEGQNNLGIMYDNGVGVPKDEKLAVYWYRKAAEQGNASAQSNLGATYTNGTGVPKDEKLAVDWYRKAAEQGNASGQLKLGVMYANGTGMSRNGAIAYMLFNLAAANGNDAAANNRKVLDSQLSRAQIAEGQALSSAWKVGTPLPKTSKSQGEVTAPSEVTAAAAPTTSSSSRQRNVVSCTNSCVNGNCIRSFSDGRKERWQAPRVYNAFTSDWEWETNSCGK